MQKHLSHMTCLVAGGAGGIGREACLDLGARGATVIAAGRPGQSMNNLRKELDALACRHTIIDVDLRLPSSWSGVVDTVLDTYGRVDVLVNSAGVVIPGRLDALAPEELRDVIDANFTAVVLGAHAVVPVMRRQRSGHIITVGSIGGIVPMPYEAIYSATKFAVRGFSLSLYHELRASGIAVSLVSPGPVRTKMLAREAEDDDAAITYVLPPLEAQRVARAIVRTIERPRIEVVLPFLTGKCSALLAAFPGLFAAVQPLLRHAGRRRLLRYRRMLVPAFPEGGTSHDV